MEDTKFECLLKSRSESRAHHLNLHNYFKLHVHLYFRRVVASPIQSFIALVLASKAQSAHYTVVLIRDQTRSVAKQVSVAVGWVKIKISLMAQLKGLTSNFKLM